MRPSSSEARRIRARLEARRRELLVRYRDLLDHAEAELADHSPELIDVANDQWDARVLAIMTEHDAVALEHVVAALHRLDLGNYGVCTRCGERVSSKRLRVLPDVARCASCATEVDKRRHVRTAANGS